MTGFKNLHLDACIESLPALSDIQTCFATYQQNHFEERKPEFFALELSGEVGEVANNEKKLWKGREIDPSQLADEAADVFIALLNYANSRSIDLADAVQTKLTIIERIRIERKNAGLEY